MVKNPADRWIWRTAELKSRGMTRYDIDRAVEQGTLFHALHGIYTTREATGEEILGIFAGHRDGLVYTGSTAGAA